MAYELPGTGSYSIEAGSDLSAAQYKFVTIASDGQIDVAGAGANVDGVLQNKPDAAGQAATVHRFGITKVVCGEAITVGTRVKSDASGRAVSASTGNGLGKALTATAVAGELVTVLLESGSTAGEDEIFTATGTIATAAVKTMFATPVSIVAAPGAAFYIEPVSMHWFLDFGTAAYDSAAAADLLGAKYTNASGAQILQTVAGNVFGNASADAHICVNRATSIVPVANAAVVATIDVSEWFAAAGDSPLKYEFKYRVRTLLFA